jgi:dsRNA-specific ribonuclease
MADNLTWPESYLTGKKGKIVSNGFAARATLAAGLDKFILTKRFTGAKWKPRYAGDILAFQTPDEKRTLSSKILADVVESLIGASYVVGGFAKAFVCIQTLLPLERWTPIPEANTTLFNVAPTDVPVNSLSTVESLIDYTFHKKVLLLEALTHASYKGPHAHCSYERLEFLGDSVLDYIISKRLYAHEPPLSHQKMHAIRTSMVNADFLTFCMLETTVQEEQTNPAKLQKEVHYRWLWQYLRAEYELAAARDVAIKQHNGVRQQIRKALEHDAKFPWQLLALTHAPKFLSDIVESIIGAVYIDSRGDVASCEGFVRRLGLLDSLQGILDRGVDCLHPKERLGHLAVDREVQYVMCTVDSEDGKKAKGKGLYGVQVSVGGVKIGGVVEGLRRLNAETVAAYKAVGILEGGTDVVMADGVNDVEMDGMEDGEDGGISPL